MLLTLSMTCTETNIHARVKICYMVKNTLVKLLKYLIYESEIIKN